MPMPEEPSSQRVLDPANRVSEVVFGLIMVLTFTGSLSIGEASREDIRTMLIGALGCNLAWGIIDAVLYLMGCMAERGRNLMAFQAVRKTHDSQEAQRLVANAFAIVMLFLGGYAYGQFVGRRPWVLGIALVLLGVVLVGLTKALGG